MRTFVVHVEDKPGVLNRVASLFRRRSFNIESLNVGHTHERGVSRMTIVVDADADKAKRIEANLYKLVSVLHVEDVSEQPSVVRTMAVIKVEAGPDQRGDVLNTCEIFRARVVDAGPDSLIVEGTGTCEKIEGLISALRPFGITETVRAGAIAMTRGRGADNG